MLGSADRVSSLWQLPSSHACRALQVFLHVYDAHCHATAMLTCSAHIAHKSADSTTTGRCEPQTHAWRTPYGGVACYPIRHWTPRSISTCITVGCMPRMPDRETQRPSFLGSRNPHAQAVMCCTSQRMPINLSLQLPTSVRG